MVENYDGLNVILRQRFNHGLSMLVSYTWSHTLDVLWRSRELTQ